MNLTKGNGSVEWQVTSDLSDNDAVTKRAFLAVDWSALCRIQNWSTKLASVNNRKKKTCACVARVVANNEEALNFVCCVVLTFVFCWLLCFSFLEFISTLQFGCVGITLHHSTGIAKVMGCHASLSFFVLYFRYCLITHRGVWYSHPSALTCIWFRIF